MRCNKKLIIGLMSILMITPIMPITSVTHPNINAKADAEPQFNKKALSGKTWHQTPAANNINDVRIIKFESGTPVGTGHYIVEVNGLKFLAAGDSKLGQQIKTHQKQMKETKIKRQEEAQRRIQQAEKIQEKRTRQKQNKQNQIKKSKPNANESNKNNVKPHRKHYGIVTVIAIIVIALLGWIFRSFTKNHHNN